MKDTRFATKKLATEAGNEVLKIVGPAFKANWVVRVYKIRSDWHYFVELLGESKEPELKFGPFAYPHHVVIVSNEHYSNCIHGNDSVQLVDMSMAALTSTIEKYRERNRTTTVEFREMLALYDRLEKALGLNVAAA